MIFITKLFNCGIAFILMFCIGETVFAKQESSDLDNRVDSIIKQIANGQYDEANTQVDSLLKTYPNFRLGHAIKGDLILMRARPLKVLSGNGAMSSLEREGLRSEAKYRVDSIHQSISDGTIPSNLWVVPNAQRYLIAVDTSKSRLYVLEHLNGQFHVAKDYYMSIGKAGPEKRKRGDNRTPVGVYHVTSFISSDKLPDYYGSGAFPINYPNLWDSRNKRDGSGIWIHGTPSSTWSRPPLASEGCVVLPNADFKSLQPFVNVGNTPVLISTQLEWVKPEQLSANRDQFLSLLTQWKKDFESLNTEKYLSHYSKQFSADGMNYSQWANRKRQVNSAKTWITIDLANISVTSYPGNPNILVVSFDQDYKSSNLNNQMKKTQYWQQENGEWKIIYEGASA